MRPLSAACGKREYVGRKEAAHIAARARKRTKDLISAYHCAKCHCWHIGHTPGCSRASS